MASQGEIISRAVITKADIKRICDVRFYASDVSLPSLRYFDSLRILTPCLLCVDTKEGNVDKHTGTKWLLCYVYVAMSYFLLSSC